MLGWGEDDEWVGGVVGGDGVIGCVDFGGVGYRRLLAPRMRQGGWMWAW